MCPTESSTSPCVLDIPSNIPYNEPVQDDKRAADFGAFASNLTVASSTIHVESFNVETINEAVEANKEGPLYPKESCHLVMPNKYNDLLRKLQNHP